MSKISRLLSALLSVCVLSGTIVLAANAEDEIMVDTTTTSFVLTEEERSGKTADEIYAAETAKVEEATNKAHEMSIASNAWQGWPEGPATYGEAAIVMDAKSGAILYAKNIDGKAYPASITKILTALVALENARPEDKVTITDSCIDFLEYGDAHIGLAPGEEITLDDALHALLLASANEAAYAIGANVGESYEWFINQMNTRAEELGAVNTHFMNTNGLQDVEHYTTAHDMALITRELLLSHEEFQTISKTLQYTIAPTNLQPESRVFQQKHKMFYEGNTYYYENVVAGKTGYTQEALNTLVTCADDGNMQLVCVVLKTYGKNVYPDTRALFDYAYTNFQKVPIAENEKSKDFEKIDEEAYVVVPQGVEFKDLEYKITPSEKDKATGSVNYSYKGTTVGTAEAIFSKSYMKANMPEVKVKETKEVQKDEGKKASIPKWLRWLLIGLGIMLVILLIWFFIALHILKKRKLERKKRKRRGRRRK